MRSKICIVTMLGIFCAYSSAAQLMTASNGLSYASGNVTLGGNLTGNTTIGLGSFSLNLSGTGNTILGSISDDGINKLQVNGHIKAIGKLISFQPIVNNVVNTLGLFGYSNATDNRSISIQQIGNASTVHQYFFLNGGMGSSSVVGTPMLTSAFAPTFGFESNDNNLNIIMAAAGTNVTAKRPLSVSSTGFIGLGTTSPQSQLHMYSTATDPRYFVQSTNSSGVPGFTILETNGSEGWTWHYNIAGGFTGLFKGGLGNTLIISNAGRVGIGTLSVNDVDYKLFVETGIKTRKIKVDQLVWSDYVFYPDYRLRPLPEVEKFIRENNHLPDVPSAAEVEKDGLNLGDSQALLLKKIEELTLYVIEQNKKLESQGKRITELESKRKVK